ncbi:MAG: pilin [Candidatus Pacebacteria bacterium]|nr:pilin [Candidatus Paceibacterota bacterium]MDD5013190.1 pilin [Candidatus Paceibacterota bacterium]MDD5752668.1 pilin [Candidatus Paceibacterota bacterium]
MNPNIIPKKIVLVLVLFFLFSITTTAVADCPEYKAGDPIVFCGNEGQDPCTFDDLFCLINRVITFIMFNVVPPLAIIWFAFGGITMMTAGGDPSKIQTGKKMITYGIIGVLVVYAAWLIVYGFVSFLTGGGDPWPLNFFQNPNNP